MGQIVDDAMKAAAEEQAHEPCEPVRARISLDREPASC